MKNLIPVIICLFLAIPSQARTSTVDANGTGDYPTIQAAIDDSNDGDIIVLQLGTYTGDGNRDLDFWGLAITVRSTDPNDPNVVAATIIDCNGTEAEHHRGFYFHSGEDANCVLSGFTITNGYAEGGGIYCKESSPTLTNCVFSGNSTFVSGSGGGIYNFRSRPMLTNCVFNGNSANFGGGIFNIHHSHPTLLNCTFSGNTARDGGGMLSWDSYLTLINCTFSGNTAESSGGGMYNIEYSRPTLTNCTFINNSAGYSGGGMYNYDNSNPTLTNCVFSGNSAFYSGGGICNVGDCLLMLINCTFSGNSAEYNGGGIYSGNDCFYSTVLNCTFSGNSAEYNGGGIFSWDSYIPLVNCTLVGNSALNGNALACDSFRHPSTVELYNCILWDGGDEVWNNDGSTITITYSDVQGGFSGIGNIDIDPCFVELGQWVDVNGPNIIVEPNDPNAFWIDGDYHLKSFGWRWDSVRQRWDYDEVTSRCIDAGNPGSWLFDELMSVPDDPCNIWGENIRINMGAYGRTAEASMPPYDWAILADLTNDGIVDYIDLGHWLENWLETFSGRFLPSDLNRNSVVDMFDFALFGQDWPIETSWHQ